MRHSDSGSENGISEFDNCGTRFHLFFPVAIYLWMFSEEWRLHFGDGFIQGPGDMEVIALGLRAK